MSSLLSCDADKLTDDGRQRLVRHGHLPEREIMTAHPLFIGDSASRAPVESPEVLMPILYLKGISIGDFEDALIALLGRDTGGLSASTIGRLKEAKSEEHVRWSTRDLLAKRYIGSAVVLQAVLRLAEGPAQARSGVPFAFWDAEERGLIGSRYHIGALYQARHGRLLTSRGSFTIPL